jgi:hypothetical protein
MTNDEPLSDDELVRLADERFVELDYCEAIDVERDVGAEDGPAR